jgi:gentisate 1,2-dioxygenase
MAELATQNDVEARAELRDKLWAEGIRIAQPDDQPLFTRTPQSPMVPMHWKAGVLEDFLEEIGRVLNLEPGGDRRTLRLANPGLEYGTTPTFWASIQFINPGEVATAHRHTPDAFRFILQGEGCSSTVEGERYEFSEGDLVLTPNWMFHDHVHEGDKPMIWLDVLDVSVMRKLDNIFFDPHEGPLQAVDEYPETSLRSYGSGIMRPVGEQPLTRENPLLVYSKDQTEVAIERARGIKADPRDDVILEYQNPINGASALPSMSMKSQLIRPGFHGAPHRHSGSKVYYVISGTGTMIVNGERFDWAQGDFLAVPPWATTQHLGTGSDDARLFRVDDSPILRYLNAYHEETLTEESEKA